MLGLSIALAVSFIILLYIINELSYNYCHKNRNQIFRVLNNYSEFKTTQPGTPYILASTLKEEFPQVEKAVNAQNLRSLRLKSGDEFINVFGAVATGSEIFDMFTIPLIGSLDAKKLLDNRNSIVLSKEIAEKFFPGEDPTGKGIVGLVNNEEQMFTVTGVFEDIPVNSTFRAKCFVNSEWTIGPINDAFNIDNAETSWEHDFWTTWVFLSDKVRQEEIDSQFRNLETKYPSKGIKRTYSLQKLSDVYLKSENLQNAGLRGDMKNIRLFSAIAFLILLVASINYIMLSTAVSSGRSKEIGIRKTNGAGNNNIKNQLLSESVILALLVLPIALILTWVGLPFAGKLFQTRLNIIDSNLFLYILVYLALTILIGLTSGIYTSGWLSRLKVIDVLKSTSKSGNRKQNFRSFLIVIQLVIFCTFVSATLIIRSQYNFALTQNPGHHNSNIVLIDLGRNFKNYSAYINSIQNYPNVINAAGAMHSLPMLGGMSTMHPHFTNPEQQVKLEGMAIDFDFLKVMGIQVVEGRDFSRDFNSDLTQSVILNETAVRELGIVDPVGKKLWGSTIIGVVKDFNLHSIHTGIPPLQISMTDRYIQQVAVHYQPGTLGSVLPLLETEWKEVAPDRPFSYTTIEDLIEGLYSTEKNLSTIVSIFALFTLLIAAFGLFGLTLFVARSRTKEIGIKKVFGSSEKSIIYSFLKEDFIMVVVASILAIPITYYFMDKWLSNFSYKVDIKFWFFVVAFFIAMLVVLLTVLFHSFRASRTNPVETLRYE
ncbi:ABC transporter permease [Tangfeifania diversioriginum]|nr:FtsX-like permease family protein [Tangfeifania diversioriginum]